ncbi:hypothetical protein [Leptospira ryugenii]|nr:hypothetical protein [Leptospira ryugenii]
MILKKNVIFFIFLFFSCGQYELSTVGENERDLKNLDYIGHWYEFFQ